MGEPPNWFFSACSFIGFVLCAIPLPWHLEAWNTGTCLYMIWTGLGCLNQFINSVVWNTNVIDKAPVWCDISSKFMIGTAVAIPAASLCINRRLYHIVSVDAVTKTRGEKRRDVLVDLAIGLGIPILEMILHYIVQGHRFNIFEGIGCYPTTYNTPPAYALVFCWPIAIGVVSAAYCVCTIRELALRRAQFKELLSANRNMSSSRYFRLMGLAGIEVLGTIPVGAYTVFLNVTISPIQPWISWANTHYNFSRVAQYPYVVWTEDYQMAVSLQLSRYLIVACAFIFFAFFGFADEARRNYRMAYTSIAKKVGMTTGMVTSGTWGTGYVSLDLSCRVTFVYLTFFCPFALDRSKTCRTMVVRGCPSSSHIAPIPNAILSLPSLPTYLSAILGIRTSTRRSSLVRRRPRGDRSRRSRFPPLLLRPQMFLWISTTSRYPLFLNQHST
ncbi:pheromone A receptor-domain-containing protein [Pisolithus croceorrhizus]|nr:pheromone A receptor-domain-containing protein [Pisolithus croceorrhizus]